MNDQVQAVLKQLSITQRIGIVGAALMAVALIGVMVMMASKPDYTTAFTNLNATDAGTIESALKTANIPYQLTDAGSTIEVPVSSLGDARVAAAAAGVNTDGSSTTQGWDLFNKQGFGTSAFDQNVTYQRALEGELTKTIQSMDGVASARVSIVLAQSGAVTSQDTPASAAIVLAMSGGQTPSSGLVQAIVNTTARSVQGLSTDNVVVTDNKGNVLAGASGSTASTAAQAKGLVEQQLKAKIESLLETALGPNHAAVAVSADVDTSQVEKQVTSYAPTGSNPPVSIHQIVETYGATATNGACGIPGTNSNVPGLPSYPGMCEAAGTTAAPTAAASANPSASPTPASSAAATAAASSAAGSSSNYLHAETTVNYNVSQTVEHIITQPGVVTKISVSVLVDQAAMGSMTPDSLKTTIAAAIGEDTSRGDVVAVQAIPFAAQASAAPLSGSGSSSASSPIATVSSMSGTILGAVFAGVMLLLFWLNLGALLTDEVVLVEAQAAGMDWPEMADGRRRLATTRRAIVELAVTRDWVGEQDRSLLEGDDPQEVLAAARPWIEREQQRQFGEPGGPEAG